VPEKYYRSPDVDRAKHAAEFALPRGFALPS
jgi:hypothetical protein